MVWCSKLHSHTCMHSHLLYCNDAEQPDVYLMSLDAKSHYFNQILQIHSSLSFIVDRPLLGRLLTCLTETLHDGICINPLLRGDETSEHVKGSCV